MNERAESRTAAAALLSGGGEMGAAIRALDWSRTPIGAIEHWPQSLKTVVRLLLQSRYAMFVWWGPQFIQIYNDAYAPMLGQRHPAALGQPAAAVWSDVWGVVGPQAQAVVRDGISTWNERLLLVMERNGYTEEAYFTFSYSPTFDDDGAVGGMFCAVTEETERLLGERRLQALRALSSATLSAQSAQAACELAARSLADAAHDLPFVAIYLCDADGTHASLAACAGAAAGSGAAPLSITLADGGDAPWPLAAVLAFGEPQRIDDIAARCGDVHAGPWPEAVRSAVALPLVQAGARLAGFFVAGLSPRRPFDSSYENFVGVVAAQVGNAISDARAFEHEMQRAEALAELDRAKTMFFSNVSHELRTPLTLMLGPLADLRALWRDAPAEAGELLELAQRNGLRLKRLVNSLLDFSRIEAGQLQASYEPVDLAAFTAELASVFRSAVEKARLTLVVDCPPLPEPVFVDRALWEKIVLNLLSNALKHTFEGEIGVALKADGDAALLVITDTGVGIPAVALPRLFERFYRVEGARGRTIEGSGIGLALVHDLARLHGGSVGADSREGAGSRFHVRIPFGSAHLPPEQVVQARPGSVPSAAGEWLDEAGDWLRDTGWAAFDPLPADEPPPALDGDSARPRVLVADDNADMRGYLRRLLERDHDVIACGNGVQALELTRERAPDLVLSDVMMSRLDGFALLRALRADRVTAATPVILLSARADDEARIEGLQAGADDYLTKPFSARELLARVAGTLALARARRETEAVLESITEGFVAVDTEWRYTYINAAAEAIYAMPRAAVLGRSLWEAFPETLGSPFEAPYRRAMAERVSLRVDAPFERLGGWFEVNVYPIGNGGLAFYFRDVLQSRLLERSLRDSEARHRFLLELDAATQALDDPQAILTLTMRRLGEHIGADRCLYAAVDDDEEGVVVADAWMRSSELPSLVGRWRLADYGRETVALYRAGRPLVVDDVDTDPRVNGAAYRALGIGATVSVGLMKGGRLVAAVALHQCAPRRWTGAEVELVQTAVRRCWEAIERASTLRSLRSSEERFRRLADSMPHMVFSAQPDGRVTWINRYAREFTGVTDEMLGTRRYGLIYPDDRERMRAAWTQALGSGQPYQAEVRMRRADGVYRWLLSRALPVHDAGRIVEWVGGSVDIDELRQAQQALQDADRRKDEFLATLAHELRNPLAPLRNAVHILQLANSAEAAGKVHQMMQRQIDHLVRLVDDLMEVSRITSGKIELQRVPVALSAVLTSAIETSRPLIEAAGHRLELDIAGSESIVLDADAVRLAQVFANLLNNAAKYTEPGGRIELAARRDAAQAIVTVSDSGIGIEPEMLPRVFELFTQADRSAARQQGGLGIGLSLVRSLLALHGGSVEANSEGVGRGSEFVVRLPLRMEDAPATQRAPRGVDAALPAATRVLVVDDNRDAADSLGVLLEFLGASVRVAHDGPAALAAFEQQRPAMVLLDIGMPGMDGHEVARRLRALPAGAHVTLVALTGWGQQQDRERSREAGFDQHLVKPVDVDSLKALLSTS